MIEIDARLHELRALGLQRRIRLVSGPQGPHVVLDGKPVLLLCSNNYLGFADHPRVRQAAANAATRWGVGTGASRLASGTMTIHRRLEERLAEFHGRESALLFGSGLHAGTGAIAALARPGDVIFSDELAHASIIDGCRLSRAEVFVYNHCDVEHLAWASASPGARRSGRHRERLPVDGDVAPLADLVEPVRERRIRLLVDEGHAIGALGPGGRGALAQAGLEDQADVIVGALDNALGSYGAYVACDRVMARYLQASANTFLFSTALPPPAVAGALAALDLLRERPQLVRKLAANSLALREALTLEGFALTDSQSQIVSVPLGDDELAVRVAEAALTRGVFAQAIIPPAAQAMELLPAAHRDGLAPHRGAEGGRACAGRGGWEAGIESGEPARRHSRRSTDSPTARASRLEARAA